MKGIENVRKFFVTFAAILLLGAFGAAIYFGLGVSEEVGLGVLSSYSTAVFVFILGLVLAESKNSGAHRFGIGLHLAVMILESVKLAVFTLKFFAAAAEAVANGTNSPYAFATVPLFVALGGVFFYFFSFIFGAVAHGKAVKIEEQKEAEAQYAAQQYYQEPQPVYEQPVEQPVYEEPAPAPQPEPAVQPMPYPAPVFAQPAPAPVVCGCGCEEKAPSKEELAEAIREVVKEELEASAEKAKFEAEKRAFEEEKRRFEEEKAKGSCCCASAPAAAPVEEPEPSPMPEDDVHVAAMMKWKKLYLEGIITEREFIRKRDEVLGLRRE